METVEKKKFVSDEAIQVSQELQDLNAKWRNYVAEISGMESGSDVFQVVQGNLGLQTADSSGLFLMADAIPTDSPTGYYQTSSNMRSSGFGNLLFSLAPQDSSSLRDVLGDMYTNWVQYRAAYYTNPNNDLTKSQEVIFEGWANGNLDPNEIQKAISVFKQAEISPLNKAINAYTDPTNQEKFTLGDNTTRSLYRYSGTIDNAKNAIATGQSISQIDFDSAKQSSSSDHTFAEGAVEGFYDIFAGEGVGTFDQLNKSASSARITITGHIGKTAQLQTLPGAWYSSDLVGTAFNSPNDNTVWNPTASNNWDSMFGQPDGMLARYITSLMLVSDYELTVTIHANFSESDYQKITTEASVGIWPFFGVEASSTHTKTYNHNEDGSLTYTISLNKGLIGIWGVNYRPAP